MGQDRSVSWAYFTVSLVGLAFVVNAYTPIRRGILSVPSFFAGWPTSELPFQHIAWQVTATAVFAWFGAFKHWPGWVGLGVTLVAWAGLVGLGAVAIRSRHVVSNALDTAGIRSGEGASGSGIAPSGGRDTMWRGLRLVLPFPLPGRVVRSIRNVDYHGEGTVKHRLDIITRRQDPPSNAPVFVYVHGGGWVIGDKREQGLPMLFELARRGWVCVTINYRLSPRATWPDHIVDAKRAIAWVRTHIEEYGGSSDFIATGGGSAGGHLAALLALTPCDPLFQPGFEDADTSVDACLPFYGVPDLSGGGEDRKYADGLVKLLEDRIFKVSMADDPELFRQASPVHRVNAAAPPFLVVQGLNDTLVPFEEARRFVDALGDVSKSPLVYVELPRTQHAFDVLPSIRSAHVVAGAVRFLEAIRRMPPKPAG